ncbi:MAG: hypothetical protein GEU93_12165 [Propionibacteriales bacterium]|nr:hypothetical protein [Propionibacteriales bacterium]
MTGDRPAAAVGSGRAPVIAGGDGDPVATEAAVAAYVAGGGYDRLPAPAVRVAKLAIRDCLGVILAGLAEPSGRIVADQVRAEAAVGTSTALGRGFTTSPAAAAFVNGTTAHALDFDDSHHPSMTHPTAVLLPALLAVAEQRASSGAELIAAYLYALDAATAIAGGINPDHYSAGWHPTATIGAIGAALGVARLLNHTAERTAHAVAIAANRASGMRSVFGSMGKAMNAGTAAQTGILAAALAERGFTGGSGVLAGFVEAHGGGALRLSHALDRSFTAAVGGLSIKRYPSCGVTQAPIEAALRLAATERVSEEIDEIICTVDPYVRRLVITHPPRTGTEARFNLEHCVTVALVDRMVGMAQFSDERVGDPRVRDLASRVRVRDRAGAAAGPDMRWPCVLRVVGTDGSAASAAVDAPAGRGFGELLPERELLAKFADCARWGGLADPEVAWLVTQLDQLETLPTVEPLTAALRRTPRRG